MQKGQIEIFKTAKGSEIQVNLDKDTVWLDAHLIAHLFDVQRPAIVKHIKNIYDSGELEQNSTCSILEQVASDGKKRKMNLYNLDVILSVGYRVNSFKATQFRIWATKRLKEYLVQGYALNQKRLAELNQLIQIIEKSEETQGDNQINESKGLLEILRNYTKSFILLNQYDSNSLELNALENNITYQIEYNEALDAISKLKKQLIAKKEAAELFGNQKDKGFSGILKSVVQTFDGEYLYPTIEEQASHLLYFVIKNHPFSDGNKRIGAFLFVWFLEKNKYLFKQTGEKKINDNALTALALLVAQSNPNEKELMIKLICNLIN